MTFVRILNEKLKFYQEDKLIWEYFVFHKANLPGSKIDLAPLYLLVHKMDKKDGMVYIFGHA